MIMHLIQRIVRWYKEHPYKHVYTDNIQDVVAANKTLPKSRGTVILHCTVNLNSSNEVIFLGNHTYKASEDFKGDCLFYLDANVRNVSMIGEKVRFKGK